MGAKLLGNIIIRKSDGKRMGYIGVVPMMNKKVMAEWMDKFPPSRYNWVEYRQICSPKTSKYKCK